MNHEYRALTNLFQNDHRKFKTIVSENIKERISVILEDSYKKLGKNIFNSLPVQSITEDTVEPMPLVDVVSDFEIPKGTFVLKDGTSVRIDPVDENNLFKLYENLNNNGKERFKKVIFESKSGFDRLINLARIESKKHV